MNGFARMGIGPLLFTAIWLFFMIAGQSRLFRDPGTQWHTVVGERVLALGFTNDEPFSFTKADERWIPHQWLGEVAMALAHRFAGFDTFLLLTATAYAVLFTWLTLRLIRTGLNFAMAILASVLMIGTVATHIHVRPMLFTHFALAITYAVLIQFEEQRFTQKKLLWLLPLFALWTNIHGGMLGGWVSMGLVIAGWMVFRIFGWPNPLKNREQALALFTVLTLCGLTAFATPYGTGIFQTWRTILDQPRIGELIEEHQPLNPLLPASWPLIALAALYLFVFAGTLSRKPQVTWLLPLFWLVQAGLHVRHSPLFGLTAFLAITAMWPHTRWAAWLATHRPDVYDPQQPPTKSPRWAWGISVVLLGITFTLQTSGVKLPVIGRGWAGLDAELWPVDLVDDIRSRKTVDGRPARFFNDCGYGGFLIYHAPACKIFVDDRAELYGEAFLEDFIRGGNVDTRETLYRWQRDYGDFDFALVKNDTDFDRVLGIMNGWTVVHRGQVATLYERVRSR